MSQQPYDIVVVGGINSDFVLRGERIPDPGETLVMAEFFQGPGGKGANQAVAAARLGARVAMVGCVGNDERGDAAIANLEREGVETKYIVRAKVHTGVALILVDVSGEKSIGANMGANAKLSAAHFRAAREAISSCKVLLLQLEVSNAALLAAAKLKRDGRVVLDPAPARKLSEKFLRHIEVIRPNSSEAETLTGVKVCDRKSARKAADILLKSVSVAIIQTAEGGDLIVSKDEEIFLPHFKVKSVDATGAGDAFAAGIAVALAEGKSLAEAGRMASATAALKTTKMGAQAGLPTRRALDRFLKQHR